MFRFTIRELVLVTTIVAMGMSWWADRRLHERQAQRWTKELEKAGDAFTACRSSLEEMRPWMEHLQRQIDAKQPDQLELYFLVNSAVERQLILRDEALQPSPETGEADDPFSP